MSFLSALGKIGKGAIGLLPGGGAVTTALDAIGGIASGAASGSAQQRVQEAPSQVNAYTANLQGQQLADKRAALSSLLGGGLQDVQFQMPEGSTIPQFGYTGGLRPSAMNQSALLAHLSQATPTLALPKAGLGEKILGGVGLGANVLGALGQIAKKPAASYNPQFDQAQASSGVPAMPWTLPKGYQA